VYVRFRSQSLLSSEAIDGRRRDFQMNEGKRQNLRCTFVCNALGYRLMQLAPRGWEMKDTFGAEAISLFLAIGYTLCPQVRILFVETRKRKVSKKCRPNQPTNQPTHQTNQPVKKTKLSGPGWGAKNLLKRRQVRKPFFPA
jgi:hypothetical protein